jgi:hypothetical protein
LSSDRLEFVLFNSLLEGLLAEVLDDLSSSVSAELLLKEAGRHLARAEAFHAYVFAGLGEGSLKLSVKVGSFDREGNVGLAGAGFFAGDFHSCLGCFSLVRGSGRRI